MNGQKLKKLFAAARNETAPAPSADFAADVLRAVRREQTVLTRETFSVFDQLNLLFPKVACAAVAVIVLGVAADFGLTAAGVPDLSDGVSQISAQWLLTPTGF
jgi:anti-sigma-K factor RskA